MARTFQIGTVSVESGAMGTGYIESAYLRDGSRVRIPLIILHGSEPGPVLWVGSTVHGDEIPGCEVIRRLVHEQVKVGELRGTVVGAPVQHPVAFLDSARNTAHDGLNINRVFPGDARGTLTHRIAYDLFHQGIARADAVLDIHSNAPGAVCFTIVRVGGTGAAWDRQWELADAFRVTVAVGQVGEIALGGTMQGMLQEAALAAGKPGLTVELSGGYLWEEASVRAGVTGVLNVMRVLGMLPGAVEPQRDVQVIPGRLATRHHITCERGGFVRPLAPIGAKVRKADPVVALYDVFGIEQEVIRSPIDGWIMTYPLTGNRTAVSGDTVVFVFGP